MKKPRRTHNLIACALLVFGACVPGIAAAEVFKCKLANGKTELRDFPCDASSRPASPPPQRALPPTQGPNPAVAPSYRSPQGFATAAQFEASRNACERLMSQFDFTAPMMRCGTNDSSCFSRANQESSAIFQRLIAQPEWKRQQCDLVLQMEGAANNKGDKSFEVVGTVQGCKYFVAEQGASYSLIEDWLCFRPSRGETGYGDIGTYGPKEIKLNGSICTAYIDDWSLGRNRAAEKLHDKCR